MTASADEPVPLVPRCFYDGTDYPVRDSVAYLLHQVTYAMRRDIEQRMCAHALTAAQWYPLWRLKTSSGATAQSLAREMDVDAGAMTRLLDRLEAKGLVVRERSSTDRRVVQLGLTAAGEAVAGLVPHTLAAVNNQYLRGFDHDEWTQLRGLLTRLLANAGSAPSDAGNAPPAAGSAPPDAGSAPPAATANGDRR